MKEETTLCTVGGMAYKRTKNGTYFHAYTPWPVIERLEDARINKYRVRLFFGDTNTGKDWMEENDVIGYIGRSTGIAKIPILLHNSRSVGGGAILDHCIVKIMVGRKTVYEFPGYQVGKLDVSVTITHPIRHEDMQALREGYLWKVLNDGNLVARFKTNSAAERWVAFMVGERHTKGGIL